MADRLKRGAPAATKGPSKVVADVQEFAAGLRRSTTEIESLCKNVEALKGYGELCDRQTALRKELEEKEQTIQELGQELKATRRKRDEDVARLEEEISETKRYQDRLTNDYHEQFKAWDADKNRHATDSGKLSQLRDELEASQSTAEKADRENREHTDKLARQERKLHDYKEKNSALQDEGQMNRLKLKKMQTDLEFYRRALATTKDDLGILSIDREKMRQSFEDLATKSLKLVQRNFAREIPGAGPHKTPISGTPLVRIPLVESDSAASQLMRCAFAEALIAQELVTHVFRDFCLPEEAGGVELGRLNKALTLLEGREATVIRCQLARASHKRDEPETVSTRAAESVCNGLNDWLGDDKAPRQQFKDDLVSLFSEAVELWRRLQRTGKHIEAVVDLTVDWYEGDARPEYDGITLGEEHRSQQSNSMVTGPVVVLFPQIYSDGLLFDGRALFPTQSAVIAALQERGNQQNSNATHRRRASDQAKSGRKLNSVSGDETHPGTSSDLSYSERASLPLLRRTDPAASVSSKR